MTEPPPEHGVRSGPPAWFDVATLGIGLTVALFGTFGLAAAIIGGFNAFVAVPVGVVAAAALLWWARGAFGGPGVPSRNTTAALLALVLVMASFVWNAWAPGQHVLMNRDPGVYAETARWLDRAGSLEVDRSDGAFADIPVLGEAAVYDSGPGTFEFQFNHLSSVVLASSYGFGGHRAMWRTPALAAAAGLMALYSVAVRASRRPYASLLAPAAFGLTMPFVAVARDTYSESFVVLLLWSGLLAAVVAYDRSSARLGVIAGVMLGATVGVRVDSLIYFAALFPLAGLALVTTDRAEIRRRAAVIAATFAGAVIPVAVGTVDLIVRSGLYHEHLSKQITQLRLFVLASFVATVVMVLVARMRGVRDVLTRAREPLAGVAGGVLAAGLLAMWLLRPEVQEVRGPADISLIGGLQTAEGVEVEPNRLYDELSLQWMVWYLGPVAFAAALAGMVLTTFRSIRARVPTAALVTLGILIVTGGLYWWRPSIVPDHIWAMRRYVPAVLPALSVMIVMTVAALLGPFRGKARRIVARAIAVVVAIGAIVGPALATWPVRDQREQFGFVGVVEEACDLIGPESAVLVVEGTGWAAVPQAFRSWCGVPVSSIPPLRDPQWALDLAQEWAEMGRELVLVAPNPEVLSGFEAITGGTVQSTETAVNRNLLELSLTGRPDEYREQSLTFYVVPVAP